MVKFKLIILLSFLLTVSLYGGKDNGLIWKHANEMYKKGLYKQAMVQYDTLEKMGFHSAELFYNLGNVYFRMKDYTTAVYYFEKAKLLKPNDEGINYNLELTRTLTGDKVDALEEFFMLRWIHAYFNLMSFENWALMSLLSFLLLLISISIYLFVRVRGVKIVSFWISVLMLFNSLQSFSCATLQYQNVLDSKSAIVMSPTVTAKSSPSETGSDLFVMHDGTKVLILQQSGEWSEIRIADGNRGWVRSSDYKKI